jgi:hypothetical protein
MVRAHSRACTLSVMPGNRRRSSTAADNSPPQSKAARIAAASASLTTNIAEAWHAHRGAAKPNWHMPVCARSYCPRTSPARSAGLRLRRRRDRFSLWPQADAQRVNVRLVCKPTRITSRPRSGQSACHGTPMRRRLCCRRSAASAPAQLYPFRTKDLRSRRYCCLPRKHVAAAMGIGLRQNARPARVSR